ncbi:23S rRNA (pseudouridine(1915)-N(3))-methyltransferase RlmH [Patescibacteria group bacterium]|nr:23S rRNA (pseudouridine(1915)-N(3))-methyltransferase RlmH [Patescibacteria group bacterium]MBU1758780.1 23S rRNA (pseudouridine(1915)-N(3))-methyltransferase RlmH [Patescibacteria group bacterium]
MDEEKILPYIDFKISFSGMTLQHGLAKLVLFEQLYRVSMIWG